MALSMGFWNLLLSGDDKISSVRFNLIVSAITSNILIIGLWAYLSYTANELKAIPESVIILYGIANGIPLTGKLIQKKYESSNRNDKGDKEEKKPAVDAPVVEGGGAI